MLDASTRTIPMFVEDLPVAKVPSARTLRRRFNKAAADYCAGLLPYEAVMAAFNLMEARR